MVKPTPPLSKDKKRNPIRPKWFFPIAIVSFILYFGLPPFIKVDKEGNYVLSDERLRDYYEKPKNSEEVEVYKLVANLPGLYKCFNCPGIKAIRLNPGEIWKYGISRKGKHRYSKDFYAENKVSYTTIIITDILNAEQMEKQLIISYPMLPECQQRMQLHGIFLKRPPGNSKDR